MPPKSVSGSAFFVLIPIFLYFSSPGVTAQAGASGARVSGDVVAARQELLAAAKEYKVAIQESRIAYVDDGRARFAHAPIPIPKNANFAAGVPVMLVSVKSTTKLGIPNGSYLVKAQYRAGSTAGKALFTDRKGIVSVQRELIVRTWEQSAILFPSIFSDPKPAEIPNITSTEIFWDVNGIPHRYFNCAGVNGVLYFAWPD